MSLISKYGLTSSANPAKLTEADKPNSMDFARSSSSDGPDPTIKHLHEGCSFKTRENASSNMSILFRGTKRETHSMTASSLPGSRLLLMLRQSLPFGEAKHLRSTPFGIVTVLSARNPYSSTNRPLTALLIQIVLSINIPASFFPHT